MSHYYSKFKENPCVGTDASTPLGKWSMKWCFIRYFYFEFWWPFCSALLNALCNFGRSHCYMKKHFCKIFEFGPVVQGRCCFTDIPNFSSGDNCI